MNIPMLLSTGSPNHRKLAIGSNFPQAYVGCSRLDTLRPQTRDISLYLAQVTVSNRWIRCRVGVK